MNPIYGIFFIVFIAGLSIYFILRGHQIGGIHSSNTEEAWKEISTCKKCGASNFQIFNSKLEYWEPGKDYKHTLHPKYSHRVSRDDSDEPSAYVLTHFVKLKCLKCGNLMFDDCFEFGTTSHSKESEKTASTFDLIGNPEGASIIKNGIKKKFFSGDNGGCQKGLFLFFGYGLLIFVLVVLIWSFL